MKEETRKVVVLDWVDKIKLQEAINAKINHQAASSGRNSVKTESYQ